MIDFKLVYKGNAAFLIARREFVKHIVISHRKVLINFERKILINNLLKSLTEDKKQYTLKGL